MGKGNEKIWIGTAITKEEFDNININLIKMKIGVKRLFFLGILKYLEMQAKNSEDYEYLKELKQKWGF